MYICANICLYIYIDRIEREKPILVQYWFLSRRSSSTIEHSVILFVTRLLDISTYACIYIYILPGFEARPLSVLAPFICPPRSKWCT